MSAQNAYFYGEWKVLLTIEETDDYFGQSEPRHFVFYLDVTKRDQYVGRVDVVARLEIRGRELWFLDAHIHGLRSGDLGRSGLNALGNALMESADVEAIVVEGGARTTGARPGHTPKRFRYPHGSRAASQRSDA